jgi:hypothetical protein
VLQHLLGFHVVLLEQCFQCAQWRHDDFLDLIVETLPDYLQDHLEHHLTRLHFNRFRRLELITQPSESLLTLTPLFATWLLGEEYLNNILQNSIVK